MTVRQLLISLLRVEAVIQLLAIAAVVAPFETLSMINDRLNLHPLPQTPVVEYVVRSLSAFYAWHGAITWLLSTDVERFLGLIRFWAVTFSLFGGVLLAINLVSGMPLLWSWAEGAYVIAFGAIVYRLTSAIEKTADASTTD